MFDIGFWEISLIGVVALLVVGPERLPGMARTVGLYAGKMRRWVSQVRGEVERELRADEIRQAMRDAEKSEAFGGVKDAMRMDDVKDAFRTAGSAIKDAADAATDAAATSTTAGETVAPAAETASDTVKTVAPPPGTSAPDTGPSTSEPVEGAQTAAAESEGGRERGAG